LKFEKQRRFLLSLSMQGCRVYR